MREILFRGKRLDNGEWVLGDLHHRGREVVITSFYTKTYATVDPATVGQFTGLLDKNDRRIFEGDLFRDDDLVAVVIFKDGRFCLEWHGLTGTWTENGYDECGGGYGIVECESVDNWYVKDMEIIGNIHDNPELLEGGQA